MYQLSCTICCPMAVSHRPSACIIPAGDCHRHRYCRLCQHVSFTMPMIMGCPPSVMNWLISASRFLTESCHHRLHHHRSIHHGHHQHHHRSVLLPHHQLSHHYNPICLLSSTNLILLSASACRSSFKIGQPVSVPLH